MKSKWLACVLVTVVVSYATKPQPERELQGLVYGCTAIPSDEDVTLWQRPIFWAGLVALALVVINIVLW